MKWADRFKGSMFTEPAHPIPQSRTPRALSRVRRGAAGAVRVGHVRDVRRGIERPRRHRAVRRYLAGLCGCNLKGALAARPGYNRTVTAHPTDQNVAMSPTASPRGSSTRREPLRSMMTRGRWRDQRSPRRLLPHFPIRCRTRYACSTIQRIDVFLLPFQRP